MTHADEYCVSGPLWFFGKIELSVVMVLLCHRLSPENHRCIITVLWAALQIPIDGHLLHMKESEIRQGLARIRQQTKQGNESELVIWVISHELACSQRPLRDHPRFGCRSPLPPEAKSEVVRWVSRIKDMGIRSIICLLEYDQLDRYYIRGGLNLHPDGLLGYYMQCGFYIRHFSIADYQRPAATLMDKVLEEFDRLPKPVLIQCSASIDRTTHVVAYIAAKRYRMRSG